MPYTRVTDLPEAVRAHLPAHAHEIYLQAFNHAWTEYADRDDREAVAHRVAWAAVKRSYRKSAGRWVKR